MSDRLEKVIARFVNDPLAAHAVLFAHRHTDQSSSAHDEAVAAWHSPAERIVLEAFRNFGKSTIGEEGIAIDGSTRGFKNCLIVGSSEARAMERVESIKHELQTNDLMLELFGQQQGPIWTGHKMELAGGPLIQAVGIGQSLRGVKHHQWRPDFCWIEDIEDEESVASPEARKERFDWLFGTLIPALAKGARIRMTGNRLNEDAVIAKVAADPTFRPLIFPVCYFDESGKEAATWPAKFDMDWVRSTRDGYQYRGQMSIWEREYMCRATAAEKQLFKPEMLAGIVKPRQRRWEATYAFIDPARTTNENSATTGLVVWSWLGNRLVVWEAIAKKLLPDEQIDLLFKIDDEYQPIEIGVELDGLEEFIAQPLRQAQVKRGRILPVRGVRAPRDKLSFIGQGLQPFFAAREISFAKELPDLHGQLLSFPTGKIDAPNALAYAPRLRTGVPIYDFNEESIVERLRAVGAEDCWVAINAGRGHVTAALIQFSGGLRVLADWIEEGEPGQAIPALHAQIALATPGGAPTYVGLPVHFDVWNNLGMRQALRTRRSELRKGVDWRLGREELRSYFRQRHRGEPFVLVSSKARWTLNALAGGYALPLSREGAIGDRAVDNIYRTLMEGIESFVGLLKTGAAEPDPDVNYATTRDGRRYVCAMPGR